MLQIVGGGGLLVEREEGTEGRCEVFRVVGDDLRVVFLEVDGGLDDADGLVVGTVNQEFASLPYGGDIIYVEIVLVHFFGFCLEEGGVVLDNCMGSGSTGVACVNTNRFFIGIEKDANYFELAKNRIMDARRKLF